MNRAFSTLSRLAAWSVLLLGLSVAGSGCDEPKAEPNPPPVSREVPDAARSSVEVSKAQGAWADGTEAVDITVTVRKDDGTPLSGRTVKVTVSGEGNTVTQPVGTTGAQGVATARVTSTAAGMKTVTVTVTVNSGDDQVTLSSRPTIQFIERIVLPASRLAFTKGPQMGTAGTALGTFEVVIQNEEGVVMTDATNTVTVALGTGPATALEGTVSVAAVKGVARFSDLVLKQVARGYTLVASAEGLTDAESLAFNVAPGVAVSLVLSQVAAIVTAGTSMTAVVTAHDAFGNTATGYAGTVQFHSADTSATLPGRYTFSAADEGSRVFGGIVLKKAGAATVTVLDTKNAVSAAYADVSVVPGAAAQLVFTKQPTEIFVRDPFEVQVALLDAAGNRVSANSPEVALYLNKTGGLSGTTQVSPVNGVATFPDLSMGRDDWGYVLSAVATGLRSASSDDFLVLDDKPPAVPVLTQLNASASSVTVGWTAVGDDGMLGTAYSYRLRYSATNIVADADFNAATPVTVTSPKPVGGAESALISGLSPGTTYYVALDVQDTGGNRVRSATHPVSTPDPAAAKLVITTQPQDGTAGSALAPIQVAIQDSSGGVVGTATSAVTLTVQGVTGYGPFTVRAEGGIATFDAVRIDAPGTGYTLVATSAGFTSAPSTPFDIAPAAVSPR